MTALSSYGMTPTVARAFHDVRSMTSAKRHPGAWRHG